MSDYFVKGIDPALWHRVRVRAAVDNVTIKSVLIRMLTAWVDSEPTETIIRAHEEAK